MKQVKKVQTHFEKHKEAYIVGGVFVLASFSWLIMRERHAALLRGTDGLKTADASVTVRPLSFFDSDVFDSFNNNTDSFNTIVNVVEREGRGHPGYMVYWVEGNKKYPSQISASIAHDVSPNTMSDHINGRSENIDGKHFERILAA